MNTSKKQLDAYFYKRPGLYLFYIPIAVPYKAIYQEAQKKGLTLKENFGPILESGKLFGKGWIAVEVQKPSQKREDVIHIVGDFDMCEHRGPYKDLGKTYKKLMKECPGNKQFYNLYLDDPEKTKPENLRTQILFQDPIAERSKSDWASEQKTKYHIEVVDISKPIVECMKCKKRWELHMQTSGEWQRDYYKCSNGCNSQY